MLDRLITLELQLPDRSIIERVSQTGIVKVDSAGPVILSRPDHFVLRSADDDCMRLAIAGCFIADIASRVREIRTIAPYALVRVDPSSWIVLFATRPILARGPLETHPCYKT